MIVALIRVPEGGDIEVLGMVDGNSLYKPEEEVLWSKIIVLGNVGDAEVTVIGTDRIKTRRKLKKGDKLYLITDASAANLAKFAAIFTAFYGT